MWYPWLVRSTLLWEYNLSCSIQHLLVSIPVVNSWSVGKGSLSSDIRFTSYWRRVSGHIQAQVPLHYHNKMCLFSHIPEPWTELLVSVRPCRLRMELVAMACYSHLLCRGAPMSLIKWSSTLDSFCSWMYPPNMRWLRNTYGLSVISVVLMVRGVLNSQPKKRSLLPSSHMVLDVTARTHWAVLLLHKDQGRQSFTLPVTDMILGGVDNAKVAWIETCCHPLFSTTEYEIGVLHNEKELFFCCM